MTVTVRSFCVPSGAVRSFFGLAVLVFCCCLNPGVLASTPTPSPTPYSSLRTIVVAWSPPVGGVAPLGYKLYWGTGSGNYQNVRDVKNVLQYSITAEKARQYYFVATAYTLSGESSFSNQVIVPAVW